MFAAILKNKQNKNSREPLDKPQKTTYSSRNETILLQKWFQSMTTWDTVKVFNSNDLQWNCLVPVWGMIPQAQSILVTGVTSSPP
jgi:hypothetical protein